MISRETFSDLLLNPYQPEATLGPLRQALDAAPYCQPLQVIYAMQLRLSNLPNWEEQLHIAAVHSLYRPKLAYLMEPFEKDKDAQVESKEPGEIKEADTSKENPNLKAHSTSPTQAEIIERFLQSSPQMPRPAPGEEALVDPKPIEEPLNQPVISETMGRIYLRQGQRDKAHYIFEQLSLANPEKSAYFASLLEESAQGPQSSDA